MFLKNRILPMNLAGMLIAAALIAVALTGCAPSAPQAAPTSVVALTAAAPAATRATSPPGPAQPTLPPSTSTPAPLPTPAASATATASAATAATLETLTVQVIPVAAGLAQPVLLTHSGDGSGRSFIVEQPGTIRILVDGRLVDTPFLDIRDRVGDRGSEQGLLGLAFPPDYARRGVFFVNYTDRRGDTVIARFGLTADPDRADPASERLVLKIAQPAANHNGGMLAFGPDGYLYVGMGDGGGAGDVYRNGQNPEALLGKLLRLDVTTDPARSYTIPADNPWVAAQWNGRDVRDEVWAVGLRNPWRFSFDRATGDLWIADVGQNVYEEVNRAPAGSRGGLNFGWPIMEGAHCYPASATCQQAGLTLPVVDYTHGADGCSITGGYVYRGSRSPALAGAYLYSDYCSGKIWGLGRDGDAWRSVELLDTDLNVSSFGEDEAGEVYVVDLKGGVYRVEAVRRM